MHNDKLLQSMVDLIIESYRLKKSFEKLVKKSNFSEQSRYISQISWYDKKTTDISQNIGLNTVNLEGQKYDEGMALTPLNIDEFNKEDILYVEQMIEPTIMFENKIYRFGTAILGRVK